MDYIKTLRKYPFVQIISEPRSGSTSLYYEIEQGINQIDLCEPFQRQLRWNSISNQKIYDTIEQIQKTKNKVMKNHIEFYNQIDKNLRNKLFSMKGIKVALLRRNLFEQTISFALAEELGSWGSGKLRKIKLNIHVNDFQYIMEYLIEGKSTFNTYIKHFSYLIYYEDIFWPSQNKKNPSKSEGVLNMEELKDFYNSYMKQNEKKINEKVGRIRIAPRQIS